MLFFLMHYLTLHFQPIFLVLNGYFHKQRSRRLSLITLSRRTYLFFHVCQTPQQRPSFIALHLGHKQKYSNSELSRLQRPLSRHENLSESGAILPIAAILQKQEFTTLKLNFCQLEIVLFYHYWVQALRRQP